MLSHTTLYVPNSLSDIAGLASRTFKLVYNVAHELPKNVDVDNTIENVSLFSHAYLNALQIKKSLMSLLITELNLLTKWCILLKDQMHITKSL